MWRLCNALRFIISESRNFETTGQTAYLYFTRNNHGHASLDRDLVRVQVELFTGD